MIGNVGSFNGSALYSRQNASQNQQIKKEINDRYNEIYAHELAHKNAAGSYGGSIVIEKDYNGIPVGGYVDIKMPVLDKNNPDKTIKHADVVIASAMAPSDPSNQDYKVAAEARSIRSQAQNIANSNSSNKTENNNGEQKQDGSILNIVA